MIVCHCRVVTDRAVADAVRAGARSLGSACRATGAGQDCGACVFSLKRLVCEHGSDLVPTGYPSTFSAPPLRSSADDAAGAPVAETADVLTEAEVAAS